MVQKLDQLKVYFVSVKVPEVSSNVWMGQGVYDESFQDSLAKCVCFSWLDTNRISANPILHSL